MSTLTWLDHREEDQQRVRDALAAFDQPGIVDPLGFGVVRDAFSEMLFPGLSTVQTRARYFLFVPWAYRRLNRDRVPSTHGVRRAREFEVETIEALLAGSDDHDGIIGRNSRASTKQLPSFIYWGGLRRLGIRKFGGSRQEYVASLDQRRQAAGDQDHLWPQLPQEPAGINESATLELTAPEAEFLRDRILLSTRGTYLELLTRDGELNQLSHTPWEHPLAASAPPEVAEPLDHARLFAHAAWGASLLYNVELSRLLQDDGHAPLSVDFADRLAQWLDVVHRMRGELVAWNRERFWDTIAAQNPRALGTRAFVDWWLDLVIAEPGSIATDPRVASQLVAREARIKGRRAKLANRRARERSPTAQGGELMRFRWTQVQQITDDIHRGLGAHA